MNETPGFHIMNSLAALTSEQEDPVFSENIQPLFFSELCLSEKP